MYEKAFKALTLYVKKIDSRLRKKKSILLLVFYTENNPALNVQKDGEEDIKSAIKDCQNYIHQFR
jgi:hypothetical protein